MQAQDMMTTTVPMIDADATVDSVAAAVARARVRRSRQEAADAIVAVPQTNVDAPK